MRRTVLCALLVLRITGAATIQGTAVENLTGRPLARAVVKLTAVGPQGGADSIETAANTTGQFRFSNLGSGAYLLSAGRIGFATLRYGQKDWKSAGKPIFIEDQDSVFTAELRLRRLGAITGTVWDENQVGLALQDVVVYEATRPPKTVARVKTDDRGIYRVGELRPGRYYVRTRGTALEQGSGPLPIFFRDSGAVENAVPVEVQLDEQTPDVNIQPAVGKLYRITGAVLKPPRTQSTVELLSDMGPVAGSVDESGQFTFEQLAPGTYELWGEAIDYRLNQKYGGYRRIMLDQDLDLRLEMPKQPEMEIYFEEQNGKKIDSKQMMVWARRKWLAGEGLQRRLRVERDPLPPGNWELSVTPPAGMYVASIKPSELSDYSSPPAANGWKEVFLPASKPVYVQVMLSAAQATLSGKVTSSGKAAAGAPVYLEPLELLSGKGLITMRNSRTDLQGRYRFTGLPPGRYLVLSSFDFDQPGREEIQEARAMTVTLKEASEASQDVELFVRQ
jgi:hypothetical protein